MTTLSRTSHVIDLYTRPIALIGALLLLVELVALRVLTRTAIHIPGLARVEIGYRLVSEIGRVAFSAGVVLVVALIVAVAAKAAGSGRMQLASVLFFFLATAAMAALGVAPEAVIDLVTVIAVVAVPITCLARTSKSWSWTRLSPVLFVVAFVLSAVPSILGKVAPGLGMPVTGIWKTAEAVALVAGLALVARASGPISLRSALVGLVAASLALVSLTTQPAATETLMLWNLGLAGYFPPVFYSAAIACVVYAVHHTWIVGDRSIAVGVAFIVAGGIGLHSTIQSAAFLMGIVILLVPSVVRAPKPPPPVLMPTEIVHRSSARG
jgi:hypothetical protein